MARRGCGLKLSAEEQQAGATFLAEDAAPIFGLGTQVPRVGVLPAILALVDSGVVAVTREIYGSTGPRLLRGLSTTW